MNELATRRPQSVAEHATVNYAKALQYLGLSEGDPKAHALLLVCQRYQLDPLLQHIDLYEGKPYIKYAGYIHIGNSNPHYEGAECVREWEDDTYCYATVRVHRDDRRFYAERTGKSRKVKKRKDGTKYEDDEADAKAFAQAHRRALRLSFNVDAPEPAEDEQQPAPAPVVEIARKMSDEGVELSPSESNRTTSQQSDPPVPVSPPADGRSGSDQTSEGQTRVRAAAESRGGTAAGPRPSDSTVPAGEQPNARAAGAPTGTLTSEGVEALSPTGTGSAAPAGSSRAPSDFTSPPSEKGKLGGRGATSEAAESPPPPGIRLSAAAAPDPMSPPEASPRGAYGGDLTSAAGSSDASAGSAMGAPPAGRPAADQSSGASRRGPLRGGATVDAHDPASDDQSPTRPVSRQPGRVGGNVGPVESDPPRANGVPTVDTGDPTGPTYPVEEWAINQDPPVDLRVAKIALRKQFREDFGWLENWQQLQQLEGEQAINAIKALEAIYLDPGEGKP